MKEMPKARTGRFTPVVLTYAGVLIALNIVLSKFISIPIGPTLRLSVSQVPLILAGLWLGPVVGGLCGLAGDLLGCLLSGYAPNPFITATAVIMGVVPALFASFIRGGVQGGSYSDRFARLGRIMLVLAFCMLIGSQGSTTIGLSLLYGSPFRALWLSRLPQSILLLVVNSLLTELLLSRIRVPGIR